MKPTVALLMGYSAGVVMEKAPVDFGWWLIAHALVAAALFKAGDLVIMFHAMDVVDEAWRRWIKLGILRP